MRKLELLPLLCVLGVSTACAEGLEPETDAYQGKWVVRTADGKAPMAQLVVKGYEGTWLDLTKNAKSAKSACNGKKFPITVQGSKPSGFDFTAWGSSIAPACPDLTVAVKPVDAATLEGTISGDKPIRMTRK